MNLLHHIVPVPVSGPPVGWSFLGELAAMGAIELGT